MLYGGGGNQAVTSNKPGTAARPPAWRRTKQEVVDDKIERMLETYKLMDEMTSRKAQAGQHQYHKRLAEKYFGDDDDEEDLRSEGNGGSERNQRREKTTFALDQQQQDEEEDDDQIIDEDNDSEITIPMRSR